MSADGWTRVGGYDIVLDDYVVILLLMFYQWILGV